MWDAFFIPYDPDDDVSAIHIPYLIAATNMRVTGLQEGPNTPAGGSGTSMVTLAFIPYF